jgi:hypothetical protein
MDCLFKTSPVIPIQKIYYHTTFGDTSPELLIFFKEGKEGSYAGTIHLIIFKA